MSYLLDTNAWKTLASGAKISAEARVLTRPETALYLLDISFWEICKAVEYETLELDRPPLEWILKAMPENMTVLPITPEIASVSCTLVAEGLETEDPADQLICAAARVHRLTVATRDRRIIKWQGISVLSY
jgi:PIN domain nuclease of toxin-antitoxin system